MSRFFSFLPNRMPYTNPGAISNSGNTYFTNPRSKISKLNLDILDNSDAINSYLSAKLSEQKYVNPNTNTFTNPYAGDDFQSILSQQKNNSKSNKLGQLDPTLQSNQTTFQL
jgi:hypothetical protein